MVDVGVIMKDAGAPTSVGGGVGGDTSWTAAVTAAGHTPVSFSQGDASILSSSCVGFITTGSVEGNALPSGLKTLAKPVVVGVGRSSQVPALVPFAIVSSLSNSTTNLWTPQATGHALLPGLTSGVNFAPWGAGGGTYKHSPDPVAGIEALAYVNSVSTRNCYFVVPVGSTLTDGTTVLDAPRVYIAHDGLALLTTDYQNIQEALVDWVVGSGDTTTYQVSGTVAVTSAVAGAATRIGTIHAVSGRVSAVTGLVGAPALKSYEWPLQWKKPAGAGWGRWDLFFRKADGSWLNVGTGAAESPFTEPNRSYPGHPSMYPGRIYPGRT
jgi:hypothetical protein